ncbi:DNA mismatch repair protein MutH [Catenovulum agarivorans DS-2]|uniref:DNA mismatch repair protein MutH n=1 Tax=Catenovulum agarivorans DS-2 TaxID=1328313 RepID=W7QN84_9ALTE|nr:DNA mismatch repair endonuclease MutH [Catenovulum agarivorans]EWH09358.1 DNA mismatch repair protein MutH [Catenovulum agarivorans DS-2]
MQYRPIPQPAAPTSEAVLMSRAQAIAGLNLAQLASMAGVHVPNNLLKDKGWTGQLLEWHLGATAGSKPVPDFEHLGIELKTIPVDRTGTPLETTYICVAPLTGIAGQTWQNSPVRVKLNRVLWVPILAERGIAVADRLVGLPILWSPTPAQDQALKQDWEELMDMVALGQVNQITAKTGQYLQIRPKAANSRVRTQGIGSDGEHIQTLPRGFYLKKSFTLTILQQAISG